MKSQVKQKNITLVLRVGLLCTPKSWLLFGVLILTTNFYNEIISKHPLDQRWALFDRYDEFYWMLWKLGDLKWENSRSCNSSAYRFYLGRQNKVNLVELWQTPY